MDLVLAQVRVQGWMYDFEIMGQGVFTKRRLEREKRAEDRV